MKKHFFYLLSLIIVIVVANGLKVDAFSDKTKENGPNLKIVKIVTKNEPEKRNLDEILNNFSYENEQPKQEIRQETKQEVKQEVKQKTEENKTFKEQKAIIKSEPKKEEIPEFRVTDYIDICDNVKCFESKDAERGVVQYKSTFFYGHSTIAFDRLKTIYVGDKINVIDHNGKNHTYKISQRVVKSKEYLNGAGKKDGFTAGVYSAKYNKKQYSASFMTCGDGTNNDSAYRLILFAEEI